MGWENSVIDKEQRICQIFVSEEYYDVLTAYEAWKFMSTLLNFVAVSLT